MQNVRILIICKIFQITIHSFKLIIVIRKQEAMLYARRITYDDTKKKRVNGVSIGHDDI